MMRAIETPTQPTNSDPAALRAGNRRSVDKVANENRDYRSRVGQLRCLRHKPK
jgi:hypothetical protein